MALARSGWAAIHFRFLVFSHLFIFVLSSHSDRAGNMLRRRSSRSDMSACTERPKLVVNRTSDSKKTSRSHFGASPFASPMAYRLALAEGMPSLSHAQSTPSVLPALIFSRPRLEINFYILGSIPMFDDIQTRATCCNNKGSAGLYGDYTWGPRRYHFHLAGFHH